MPRLLSFGARRWFEYHCNEAVDSAHVHLWARSHQRVTVLKVTSDLPTYGTRNQRGEDGNPVVYRIRFDDGLVHDAFEDELLRSRAEYCRPDPPPGLPTHDPCGKGVGAGISQI